MPSFAEKGLPDDYGDRNLQRAEKIIRAMRWIPSAEEELCFWQESEGRAPLGIGSRSYCPVAVAIRVTCNAPSEFGPQRDNLGGGAADRALDANC
jgi:hypothetical protein